MKIAIGSDRRGLDYKTKLSEYLKSRGYETVDVGTHTDVPCDGPVFAAKVGALILSGECHSGILICATGIGISVAANKIKGIMCGLGYDDDVARLMREHNDCNVIAFGQNHMRYEDVERRVGIFLESSFAGQHHTLRVDQIRDLEEGKEIKLSPILNPDWV